MPLILIACFVALFIFAVIIPAYKFYAYRKVANIASKEYRLILEAILRIDTMAEYAFWQDEVYKFLAFYNAKIDPSLMRIYEGTLKNALNRRLDQGFTKSKT